MRFHLRLANESDQDAIVGLIGKVYAEYGERICLDNADSDLTDLKTAYFDRGGAFWVLETFSNSPESAVEIPDCVATIGGTHAVLPLSKTECTFRRLYLEREHRGSEMGHLLMKKAIDWARDHGFEKVVFWSDTRFERAHRFFGKFGFEKTGAVSEMTDGFEPYREFRFEKGL